MKRYLFLCLSLGWMLAACTTPPDPLPGTERDNPLISASYAAVDRLLTDAAKKDLVGKDKRVLVASLVDINQLNRSSIFGKMVAEQFASRLVQNGLPVVEIKLRSSLFMSDKSGEMLLSRELQEVSKSHNADAVVVGTYAESGTSGIYITVKLVRATDGLVLSATNFMVPRKIAGSFLYQ
jgi:TolB-like protein